MDPEPNGAAQPPVQEEVADRSVPDAGEASGVTLTRQSIPDESRMRPVEPRAYASLAAMGLTVQGDLHESNRVFVHPDFRHFAGNGRINFVGRRNFIYIDQDCPLDGEISFPEDGGRAFLLGGTPHLVLTVGIYGGASFVWGFGSVAFGVRAWVHGGRTMTVGERCLMSENVTLRTSDHHSIIDLDTGEQLNFPEDVHVGRHVWIGAGAALLKGSQVGDGSIIGTGSLVGGDVPARQAWAGVPARKIRDNVSWVASHPAEQHDIDQLREWL